jgi:hypothetical protein
MSQLLLLAAAASAFLPSCPPVWLLSGVLARHQCFSSAFFAAVFFSSEQTEPWPAADVRLAPSSPDTAGIGLPDAR